MNAPWVRWFTSDWVADTAHLGPLEEGVYSKLVHHYYQSRKPLPADLEKLCMIARATEPASRRAVEFVLSEYFIPSTDPEYGEVYRHHRIDREIEWSDRVHRASSEGGKRGMESRWGKPLDKGVSNPLNKTPYNNQNHIPVAKATAAGAADVKTMLWDTGERLLGSRAMIGKLIKSHGEQAVFHAIAECSAKNPADPKGYITALLKKSGPKKARDLDMETML